MAVVRINQDGGGFLLNQCVATVESNGQSSGALTERSRGQHPIPHTTCLWRIPFRSSVFQGVSSASPLVPAPLEFRNLPVWPATRFSWPPLGSLRYAGALGRRGYQLESCAAQICREAGARVSVNIRVQDLDLLQSQ